MNHTKRLQVKGRHLWNSFQNFIIQLPPFKTEMRINNKHFLQAGLRATENSNEEQYIVLPCLDVKAST